MDQGALRDRCETFRKQLRRQHNGQLIRNRRVLIIEEMEQREQERSRSSVLPESYFTPEYIMQLLLPPLNAESLVLLVSIFNHTTAPNLNEIPKLHAALMNAALENLGSKEGATLMYLLLRYIPNRQMNPQVLDRCLREISVIDESQSQKLKVYLAILERLTDQPLDYEEGLKVVEAIPAILRKSGYTAQLIYIVSNLSANGTLVDTTIVLDCIRAGLMSEDDTLTTEAYQLVLYFVSMAKPFQQRPVLQDLIKWCWQCVTSGCESYRKSALNKLSQLISNFHEEAATLMVECGFLRILNSNIILDKLCYRLFYFRLLRQFVTHCRQEHINNLELLADGIIDIIVDHGLGSHDLTTVSEALEILQIVLQRKGDLRENQIAARLARNPDFMELLEHLTYSNEAEVYGMATRIKQEYFELGMDTQ